MGVLESIRKWRVRRARALLRSWGYDGASLSEANEWHTVNEQINWLIGRASPRLRARVRDLVRNFPLFARGVNVYTAYMVGREARFQSLAVHPDGSPAYEARRRIEDRFRAWMEQDADISGGLHFYELQQLLCRQIMECGEGLFTFCRRSHYRVSPLALMPIEADRLTELGGGRDTERVGHFAGVEYDRLTGEKLAYHIMNDGYSADVTRVPADEMLHIYQHLRPGQLRGVTPFAPAILTARAMSQFVESELDAARKAAKYLAIVTTDQPDVYQAARGIAGAKKTTQGTPIESLENSIIEYLRPGEDIRFAEGASRPGDAFDRFNRFAARMVAVSIDVPYEVLSGDYTGINYSTSKASRGDAVMLLKPHHFMMQNRFSMPVFRHWLDMEALTQDYLPGYWLGREGYQRCMWIPAGMPSVDPQRDGRADIEAIAAGLKSPQEAILGRGGDPEEVLDQLAEWQRMADERGVTFGQVSESLSSKSCGSGRSAGNRIFRAAGRQRRKCKRSGGGSGRTSERGAGHQYGGRGDGRVFGPDSPRYRHQDSGNGFRAHP